MITVKILMLRWAKQGMSSLGRILKDLGFSEVYLYQSVLHVAKHSQKGGFDLAGVRVPLDWGRLRDRGQNLVSFISWCQHIVGSQRLLIESKNYLNCHIIINTVIIICCPNRL